MCFIFGLKCTFLQYTASLFCRTRNIASLLRMLLFLSLSNGKVRKIIWKSNAFDVIIFHDSVQVLHFK